MSKKFEHLKVEKLKFIEQKVKTSAKEKNERLTKGNYNIVIV